jgi:hypothetical protein
LPRQARDKRSETSKKDGVYSQEGHGGGVGGQPFFVEGVREALDAEGEWWVDVATDTLFMLPNTTSASSSSTTNNKDGVATTTIKVVAPKLQTLVSVRGAAEDPAGGRDGSAKNITLKGLTFAHSAPTYLEPYVVPSPGAKNASFAMPFLYKTIYLPRQARDRHRENSKKDAFCHQVRTGDSSFLLSSLLSFSQFHSIEKR